MSTHCTYSEIRFDRGRDDLEVGVDVAPKGMIGSVGREEAVEPQLWSESTRRLERRDEVGIAGHEGERRAVSSCRCLDDRCGDGYVGLLLFVPPEANLTRPGVVADVLGFEDPEVWCDSGGA